MWNDPATHERVLDNFMHEDPIVADARDGTRPEAAPLCVARRAEPIFLGTHHSVPRKLDGAPRIIG